VSIKKKTIIDTNVILRFLLNDNSLQTKQAEKIFLEAEKGSLEIPDLVIAEIVFVLLSVYKLTKKSVVAKIRSLLEYENFSTNRKTLSLALSVFEVSNISFVDSYLVGLVKSRKTNTLFSFDKKINKIIKEEDDKLNI